MKNPRVIAITGASSGIGKALALYYAAPGVMLFLHGRNEERLQETARLCIAKGAKTHCAAIDVTQSMPMRDWIESCDQTTPIDLLIANAGISAGTGIHGESVDQAQAIFATNIDGVVNSVQPIIPFMLKRGRGQIAIMSSLAGLRGLPSAPAYSASKACVRSYGEALRGNLGKGGIEVSVICPGYIRTPLTATNNFPMPLLMEADHAANIIAHGLAKNKSRIAFPWPLYWAMRLMNTLPIAITDFIFARLPSKPSGI